ncbi:DNA polymerase I [Alloscardovia macacae]|uniref:DNA polymerase I n=1 Tax=Alloscardovia macacae TaxID=1160091 RepID=A0A261F5A0_9BIFI|nr:DNA polymerase I [Alloscardovia macacae]OZG54291.1 DNA polymerase I [Alloscardovia macacae]
MVSRLLVIDGHSLAFRAYFALPADGFSTSAGQATNALYGFTTMLTQVITDIQPTHIAVAFDVKGGTFRNEMLPEYKGTRSAVPEDLLSQIPLLHDLLDSLNISYVEKQGYEGDDVIATLATRGRDEGFDSVYVVSGDRDAFQLIDETITVLYPGQHFKDLKHMTPDAVFAKYKVWPSQYPDLAALRGETADNIPGVPGVGDGFAAKWIDQYGGLDGILAHADEIKGKKGDALRENLDQVKLNRRVNALVRDVELDVQLSDFTILQPDSAKVDAALAAFEFGANLKRRVYTALSLCAGASEEDVQKAQFSSAKRGSTSSGAAEDAEDMTESLDFDAEALLQNVQLAPSFAEWAASVGESMWTVYAHGGRVTFAARSGLAVCVSADALDASVQDFVRSHDGQFTVHGLKSLLHSVTSSGVELPDPVMDTQLAAYLLKPDKDEYILEDLLAEDAHVQMEEQDSAETSVQGELDFDFDADAADLDADLEDAKRAMAVLILSDVYMATLKDRGELRLLHDVEIPMSRVLYETEKLGAAVDTQRLSQMLATFSADAEQAQTIAWQQAGQEINLQSPKQLQTVLFDDMGLPPTKKTKSGGYTTNAAALQELYLRSAGNERANTFLGALLRHREINKLKQIVQTLSDAVRADGRIHTTFEQTVAATGRLSSTEPNLQNIPNRNALGREIRSAFVPSEGNVALLSADYSQVELRLMAHLSGDEALIEAFKSGTDLHRYVASLVYGVPVEDITPDQRSHIKAMSYGLAYGLSTYGLSQQLKISPAESDILKNKYFDTFGKVHDYLESLVAEAKRKGYTETMFGRRRYFPGLRSSNRQVRDAAERGALNAPIQGSAADIMKIAMLKADAALRAEGVRSRIILQIHDELVVDVAAGEEDVVSALVKNAMEHAVELAVPLDVSTGLGADWQQAAH